MSERVMKGWMTEADFEKDTLLFKMEAGYYARPGLFYILPNTVYEELIERQKPQNGSAGNDA